MFVVIERLAAAAALFGTISSWRNRSLSRSPVWEADGPDVVDAVAHWFDDGDHIEAIETLETDGFADRERVGYRLRVRNRDGVHLVEQQAYLSERDRRIG